MYINIEIYIVGWLVGWMNGWMGGWVSEWSGGRIWQVYNVFFMAVLPFPFRVNTNALESFIS